MKFSELLTGPAGLAHFLGEATLCESSVTCAGQTFTPDEGTAYLQFQLSFAFPNVSWYGDGIMPAIVVSNFRSLLHKACNRNHQMRFYDPENIDRDRIIGGVVAVELPQQPAAGWKVSTEEAAPYIRGVAALFKNAEGVDRILGAYGASRKGMTVSQEVMYHLAECGFAVRRKDGDLNFAWLDTPPDLWEAGWCYMPAKTAPEDLILTRDWDKRRMRERTSRGTCIGKWKGRDTYFLIGGLTGQTVYYNGVGLVPAGAEPRAAIEVMVAANPEAGAILRLHAALAELSAGLPCARAED